MSCVVVLVHLGLPCWCFVAQRVKRQRFIRCRKHVQLQYASIISRHTCLKSEAGASVRMPRSPLPLFHQLEAVRVSVFKAHGFL